MINSEFIKINKNDNVAVKLSGELRGHKIALRDIKKRRKYHKIRLSYRSCDN